MDSSSDGSFAWTDASNDTIDSEPKLKDNMGKSNSDDESVSGKSYKQKLQEELFANNGVVETEQPRRAKERKRKLTETQSDNKHASPKRKKIKRESESDIDASATRHQTNGHYHAHSETHDSCDESYLDLKVKAEQQFLSPSPMKTKMSRTKTISNSEVSYKESETINEKPKKRRSEGYSHEGTDIEYDNLNELVENENEHMEKKAKKKKKKSKKRKDSITSNDTSYQDSQLQNEETAESGSGSLVQIAVEPVEQGIDTKNHKPTSRDPHHKVIEKQKLDHPVNRKVSFNTLDASVTHTPRISERIQFEDDENSELEASELPSSKKTPNRSSKLKTFVKNNLYLQPLTSTLQAESVLTADDEIFIIRCPKEVDIDAFQNKDLMLEGKCKWKLNGQTYEGIVDDERGNTSVLTSEQSNFIIKSLLVKGCLNLRKRIPKSHIQEDAMVGNPVSFIPLPETKCRHPLFGANYRKAIKIPAAISERLNAKPGPQASRPPRLPRARSRTHRQNSDQDHSLTTPKAEHSPESSVKPEEEPDQPLSSKKQKKKRKHSDTEETAPKKKKRVKHDLDSAEVWESEKAIEENLFNF